MAGIEMDVSVEHVGVVHTRDIPATYADNTNLLALCNTNKVAGKVKSCVDAP